MWKNMVVMIWYFEFLVPYFDSFLLAVIFGSSRLICLTENVPKSLKLRLEPKENFTFVQESMCTFYCIEVLRSELYLL